MASDLWVQGTNCHSSSHCEGIVVEGVAGTEFWYRAVGVFSGEVGCLGEEEGVASFVPSAEASVGVPSATGVEWALS